MTLRGQVKGIESEIARRQRRSVGETSARGGSTHVASKQGVKSGSRRSLHGPCTTRGRARRARRGATSARHAVLSYRSRRPCTHPSGPQKPDMAGAVESGRPLRAAAAEPVVGGTALSSPVQDGRASGRTEIGVSKTTRLGALFHNVCVSHFGPAPACAVASPSSPSRRVRLASSPPQLIVQLTRSGRPMLFFSSCASSSSLCCLSFFQWCHLACLRGRTAPPPPPAPTPPPWATRPEPMRLTTDLCMPYAFSFSYSQSSLHVSLSSPSSSTSCAAPAAPAAPAPATVAASTG